LNFIRKQGARHRATVSHQFQQSDRHVAEHGYVRVRRAGKGDQHDDFLPQDDIPGNQAVPISIPTLAKQ
jgi:hypothetical protein